MAEKQYKTGLYESAVQKITDWVKPNLHRITEEFAEKSVQKYAPDDPKFAKMIEFEIRRRGDGAGLTQDVAEPLLWTGVKTGAALGVAVVTEFMKGGPLKIIGRVSWLSILLNNTVDLFRLVPRYRAGLQGSLEMAKDRWESLQQTGVDPFVNRETREIASAKPINEQAAPLATVPSQGWIESVTKDTGPSSFLTR